MNKYSQFTRAEMKVARQRWSGLERARFSELLQLVQRYKLSVSLGEITDIDHRWYVTHSGLLRLAFRRRCRGIETAPDERLSDPAANCWVFKAVVHKSKGSIGFFGYGDASPTNVSSAVQGAEMRIAETRAVNRALRKAYGIGICSVEELGNSRPVTPPSNEARDNHRHQYQNSSSNGQPRLRDQLSVLIRQPTSILLKLKRMLPISVGRQLSAVPVGN